MEMRLAPLLFFNPAGNAFSEKAFLTSKRLFDIAGGTAGCMAAVILLGIVKVVYVFSGDTGPVIYRQTRIGKHGRPFTIYKIRTMVDGAEDMLEEILSDGEKRTEWEKTQKMEKDPRVTKAGRVLRKYSVDEMPQFFNVLKGEMSIIGPRPLLPGELEAHKGLPLYNSVRPGITGWWACSGESSMDYKKRLELEYEYIRNRSAGMELRCIAKTAVLMIKGKGKAADGKEKGKQR